MHAKRSFDKQYLFIFIFPIFNLSSK